MEREWQAAEEWCCAQVYAEAMWRRVIVEVPIIKVTEFWELSGTLGVDQEAESGWVGSRVRGRSRPQSLRWGVESWKCDSCEKQGVEYVWPQVSDSQVMKYS